MRSELSVSFGKPNSAMSNLPAPKLDDCPLKLMSMYSTTLSLGTADASRMTTEDAWSFQFWRPPALSARRSALVSVSVTDAPPNDASWYSVTVQPAGMRSELSVSFGKPISAMSNLPAPKLDDCPPKLMSMYNTTLVPPVGAAAAFVVMTNDDTWSFQLMPPLFRALRSESVSVSVTDAPPKPASW